MRERLVEFLQSIPEDFKDPDILLEDDGEYCVDWYLKGSNVFSVSVGRLGYSFAYVCDSNGTGHGFIKKDDLTELIEHMNSVILGKSN